MKQTITIEVPEGKTYKQTTDKDGNIVIQYIDKEHIRSKSWEEFCKNHPCDDNEYFISDNSIITHRYMNGQRTIYHANTLATKEDAKGILALIQLTRLHDEWVEGSDYKEYAEKAYIYMTKKIKNTDLTPEISIGATSHHLLDFPTYAMAKEFLKCFEDLIIKAKKFL